MTTLIEWNGCSNTITEWAKLHGMNVKTLHNRLVRYDNDMNKAVNKPLITGDDSVDYPNTEIIRIGKKIEIRRQQVSNNIGKSKCVCCQNKLQHRIPYTFLGIGAYSFKLCTECAAKIGEVLINKKVDNDN